jgi:hypothetical protein
MYSFMSKMTQEKAAAILEAGAFGEKLKQLTVSAKEGFKFLQQTATPA